MQLKDILNKNGFRFNKRFGQNFLTDPVLLDDIVAKSGITENDTVVEIGCGGGNAHRGNREKGEESYRVRDRRESQARSRRNARGVR